VRLTLTTLKAILRTTSGSFGVGFMLESALIIPKFYLGLAFNVPAGFWLRHFITVLVRARFSKIRSAVWFYPPFYKFHIRQISSIAVLVVPYSRYQE
jgi:hypothetical protein